MASQTPYIGSKISLISRLDIRYEGILYTVDTNDSTIALSKVRSFGTEDRPTANPVAARDEVYEYIIFKASDIKDLIVCETPQPANSLYNDPAIVSVSSKPMPDPVPQAPAPTAEAPTSKPLDAASKAPGAGRRHPPQQHAPPQQGGFQQNVRPQPLQGFHPQQNAGYRGGHQQQGGFANRGRGQGAQGGGFQRGGRPGAPQAPREKLKFDTDFDWEKANEELANELAKVDLEDGKKEEEGSVKTADGTEDEDKETFYDKKTSFFDRISCEALEKQGGRRNRTDWRKERETNQETFGHSAVRSLAYRRGGRGGYGFSGRGRGGYAYNGNQGGGYHNGNNYGQRGGYGNRGGLRRGGGNQQVAAQDDA